MDAVRQNHSLLGKGRCNGVVFVHIANGVGFYLADRLIVHLHVLDLIVVRGLNSKGLAAALFHRHRAARRNAAALTGGSGDGVGCRLDRRCTAAGGGELYVVDERRTAAACHTNLSLITECKLNIILLEAFRNCYRSIHRL